MAIPPTPRGGRGLPSGQGGRQRHSPLTKHGCENSDITRPCRAKPNMLQRGRRHFRGRDPGKEARQRGQEAEHHVRGGRRQSTTSEGAGGRAPRQRGQEAEHHVRGGRRQSTTSEGGGGRAPRQRGEEARRTRALTRAWTRAPRAGRCPASGGPGPCWWGTALQRWCPHGTTRWT